MQQWRELWIVVSAFPSKLQMLFKVSWKLCLSLCSEKWLKHSLNLVINLIQLRLWQLKIDFSDALINFKILFLKAAYYSEFHMLKSKLLYSITVDHKKEFLKKNIFGIELGGFISISCVICSFNARKYFEKIIRKINL